jgi:hypothetical protein
VFWGPRAEASVLRQDEKLTNIHAANILSDITQNLHVKSPNDILKPYNKHASSFEQTWKQNQKEHQNSAINQQFRIGDVLYANKLEVWRLKQARKGSVLQLFSCDAFPLKIAANKCLSCTRLIIT